MEPVYALRSGRMTDSLPQIEPVAEPDFTGRQLGDYHLLRRLGRGGMSEVYLAEQGSLRRKVAFKILKTSLALDEKYVLRFHNEAKAAAALVHANIVQTHEVGCIDGAHFIVQEYVPGRNLRQVVSRNGALDAAMTVTILRQVAAALHKAGKQGVIHRDIKPENIMLSPGGEVKVTDFGLARIAGGSVDLTQVGMTMGTPLYMSPEQVENKSLDHRSDIYSLGVTAFHMLAGRPPFEGDTALAVALQHLRTEPERLENLRDDVPPGLCRVVHRMLAKKPEERFDSAADLTKELRALNLPGLEDGWPEELLDWSSSEMQALADARSAATEQLQDAMLRTTTTRFSPRHVWFFAGGVAAAFLVGAVVALVLRT